MAAMKSVDIGKLSVDTCSSENLNLARHLCQNQALIKIDLHKLSNNFAAFSRVGQANTSPSVSPELLSPRKLVVNGLVHYIVFLIIHIICCMWYPNRLRHTLSKNELNLVASIAIIDQVTVEAI